MTSVLTNIEDLRHDLPGEFNKAKTRWSFPEIKYVDSMGRERHWALWVELVKAADKEGAAVYIKDEYYDNDTIEGIYGRITTEFGIVGGKTQKTIPTFVTSGKNLGKKNQTNAWTQSLREAISKYNDHVKGKVATVAAKEKVQFVKQIGRDLFNEDFDKYPRYPPMLMKVYRRVVVKKHKNGAGRYELVREPGCVDVDFTKETLYAQRKLNGVRVVAHLVGEGTEASPYRVEIYSRKLGLYLGFHKLNEQIMNILKAHPKLYLDGELYKHRKSLQDISGIARRAEKEEAHEELEYHIFDCFYPPHKDTPDHSTTFETANNLIDKILDAKTLAENPLLKRVETIKISNEAELVTLLEKYLDEGYEGLMLRRANMPYKFSYGDTRTASTLKVKPRYENEYKIVGYTQGTKGKDLGAIMWELETPEGKVFTAVPKGMTYEERYELYKKMTPKLFEKEYKGKLMTVEYEELSTDGVPLRAKAIVIRDYEPAAQ